MRPEIGRLRRSREVGDAQTCRERRPRHGPIFRDVLVHHMECDLLGRSPVGHGSAGIAGIAESAVLARRLPVVARFRHRLPVRSIPEQPHVAAMRHDMIDDRRRHYARGSPAFFAFAKRMRAQVMFTRLPPLPRIAAFVRITAPVIRRSACIGEMRGTKAVFLAHERTAPRMPARSQRMSRHRAFSLASPDSRRQRASCRSNTTYR